MEQTNLSFFRKFILDQIKYRNQFNRVTFQGARRVKWRPMGRRRERGEVVAWDYSAISPTSALVMVGNSSILYNLVYTYAAASYPDQMQNTTAADTFIIFVYIWQAVFQRALCLWQHLATIGKTWQQLVTCEINWQHVEVVGNMGQPLVAHINSWQHGATISNTKKQLATRGNHWQHIETVDNMWPQLATFGSR